MAKLRALPNNAIATALFRRIEILIGDRQNLVRRLGRQGTGNTDADRDVQPVADLGPIPLFNGRTQLFRRDRRRLEERRRAGRQIPRRRSELPDR